MRSRCPGLALTLLIAGTASCAGTAPREGTVAVVSPTPAEPEASGPALPFADVLAPGGARVAGDSSKPADFRPDFEGARLVVGGKPLAPAGPSTPAADLGWRVGNLRLQTIGSAVSATKEDGTPAWTATLEGAESVEFVGDDDRHLYCRAWVKVGEKAWSLVDQGLVRSLSLATGTWSEPLELGKVGALQDFLATPDGVAVLTSVGVDEVHPYERNLESYRVLFFPPDAARPAWTAGMKCTGRVPGQAAFRMGESQYVPSRVGSLRMAGKDLLVCAGAREDVIALDRGTGAEKWRLVSVWEYRRRFVGPSVWAYYMDGPREGDPKAAGEKAKDGDDEQAAGGHPPDRIIAGPFVVATTLGNGEWDEGEAPGYRVFVVVARDSGEPGLGGYLLETWLYEINDRGRPIAMVPLPRPVRAGRTAADGAGVILFHQSRGVSMVVPSYQRESEGMGSPGTDHVARVAWYREPAAYRPPAAWLTAGRSRSVESTGPDATTWAPGGGYILKEEEKVYRFPFLRMDLVTGQETAMTLEIPFEGRVEVPEDLPMSMWSPESGRQVWTRGAHLVEVRNIEVNGRRVRVTIARSGQEGRVLTFDL